MSGKKHELPSGTNTNDMVTTNCELKFEHGKRDRFLDLETYADRGQDHAGAWALVNTEPVTTSVSYMRVARTEYFVNQDRLCICIRNVAPNRTFAFW